MTAEERFSKLDNGYIKKKYSEEKFPTEGNNLLGQMLRDHIKKNLQYFKDKKEIVLLDIGSAGGALTTIFALKALDAFDLIHKTKILLVDVAEDALHSTTIGNFFLPKQFVKDYGLSVFGENGERLKTILSGFKYYCSDLIDLPDEISNVDICISGFTHHHLNIFDKEIACLQMEKVTREGGFIGVVDESLTYEQYLKWLKGHENEINAKMQKVPIGQECFIEISEHVSFFKRSSLLQREKREEYYCFSLMKNKSLTQNK